MTVGLGRASPTRERAKLVAALVAGAGLGCGDATDPPRPLIIVEMAVSPSPATHGESVTVRVTATPQRGAQIDALTLSSTGMITMDTAQSIETDGPQSATWHFKAPLVAADGQIKFVGRADGGGVSATSEFTLEVFDSTGPSVRLAPVTATAIEPGVALVVRATASDNVGIVETAVRWTGAAAGAVITPRDTSRSVSFSTDVEVPLGTPLVGTVGISVTATDLAGRRTTAVLPTLPVADLTAPVVSGTVTNDLPWFALRDTVFIAISAIDAQGLAWLGYRRALQGQIGDSIPVSGTAASAVFHFVLLGATGNHPITMFARDESGLGGSIRDSIFVAGGSRPPTVLASLGANGAIRDAVLDVGRNRVYLAQPERTQVAVLSLDSNALESPIPMPSRPYGVDLTLSQDTLLIALRDIPFLGIFDLAGGSSVVDTVRLPFSGFSPQMGPEYVRVTTNAKAFVTIGAEGGSGFGGEIWEYDLATRTAQKRTDLGTNSTVTTPLVVSGDRTRMLLLHDGACCPVEAQVYDASSNAFGPLTQTVAERGFSVSANSTGTRFLIGASLYDGSLTAVLTLPSSFLSGRVTRLSPDATIAYTSWQYGFRTVTATNPTAFGGRGFVLPFQPDGLWIHPSGTPLLAWDDDELAIVDMTP